MSDTATAQQGEFGFRIFSSKLLDSANFVRYGSIISVNDAVVIRGRYALDMIRDAQSMANDLIAASTMSVPAGESLKSGK